jgi:hypothetical protein
MYVEFADFQDRLPWLIHLKSRIIHLVLAAFTKHGLIDFMITKIKMLSESSYLSLSINNRRIKLTVQIKM